MTTMTSRRAILAGVAAVPAALAVPAFAATEPAERPLSADALRKAFQGLDPELRDLHVALVREYTEAESIKKDAKLIRLHARLVKAAAEARAFEKGPMKKANRLYEKLAPPRPEPWFTEMPDKIAQTIPRSRLLKAQPLQKRMTVEVHAILRKYSPKHPALVWYDKASAEDEKRNAAFSKLNHIAYEKSGVIECEEKYNALWAECVELCDRIIKSPAHSVLGLRLKVDALKLVGDDREEYGGPLETAWLVAQHDINRLGV